MPEPVPDFVSGFAPLITQLMLIAPLPSVVMMLLVPFANNTPMKLPLPVSLSCNVNKLALAFLRIVLSTPLIVIPFKVKVELVVLEFPIVNALSLKADISIAPIERAPF